MALQKCQIMTQFDMSFNIDSQVIPQSICILKLSALGDVVHALTVIRAIQKQWPECKITWVCGAFEYKLLSLIDNVEFIVFNKKDGYRAYVDLYKALKGRKFDVLLHMQVAARANIASLLVKAKIRLGWDRKRSRDLHHLFINRSVEQVVMQHQQDGHLSFVKSLGLSIENPQWNLPVTKVARDFVEQHVVKDKPLLVISACSSHALRNWRAESYADVADYAIDRYGVQVVLSGGPATIEMEMAEKIENRMKNSVINLVGKDTLEQLLGLLDRADVVIAPDTGPAHIANAMGTPVIGLYACTWSLRSGPHDSLEYCVDKFEQACEKYIGKSARDLFWGTKIEREGVMDLISVEEVCQKIDEVLQDQV